MKTGRQTYIEQQNRREAERARSLTQKVDIAARATEAIEAKRNRQAARQAFRRFDRMEGARVEVYGSDNPSEFGQFAPVAIELSPWGTLEIPQVLRDAIETFVAETIANDRESGELPYVRVIGKHVMAACNDSRFRDYFYDMLSDFGLVPQEDWLPRFDGYELPPHPMEAIRQNGGR